MAIIVIGGEEFDVLTYEEYLNTDEWKAKRAQRIVLDDGKCQFCGNSNNLQVHHKNYDDLFDEDMNSLITLCGDCHRKLHKSIKEQIHRFEENKECFNREIKDATAIIAKKYIEKQAEVISDIVLNGFLENFKSVQKIVSCIRKNTKVDYYEADFEKLCFHSGSGVGATIPNLHHVAVQKAAKKRKEAQS